MALSYSGTATLRCPAGIFAVHAELRTDVSGGVYSWGGRLHTVYVSAIKATGQGGTLTLPLPHLPVAEVHVTHTELGAGGGVQIRIDGHRRAPYEQDGDITATKGAGGATIYQVTGEAR